MSDPVSQPERPPVAAVLQFGIFALIGVLNTGIHFVVYQALLWVGVHYLAASVVGWICGLVNSFLLNRTYTFRAAWASWPQFVRFLVVNVAALLMHLAVLWAVVVGDMMSARPAVMPAIIISLAVNFLGNKCWVFAREGGDRKVLKVTP